VSVFKGVPGVVLRVIALVDVLLARRRRISAFKDVPGVVLRAMALINVLGVFLSV
jgi:hypothetical protein